MYIVCMVMEMTIAFFLCHSFCCCVAIASSSSLTKFYLIHTLFWTIMTVMKGGLTRWTIGLRKSFANQSLKSWKRVRLVMPEIQQYPELKLSVLLGKALFSLLKRMINLLKKWKMRRIRLLIMEETITIVWTKQTQIVKSKMRQMWIYITCANLTNQMKLNSTTTAKLIWTQKKKMLKRKGWLLRKSQKFKGISLSKVTKN